MTDEIHQPGGRRLSRRTVTGAGVAGVLAWLAACSHDNSSTGPTSAAGPTSADRTSSRPSTTPNPSTSADPTGTTSSATATTTASGAPTSTTAQTTTVTSTAGSTFGGQLSDGGHLNVLILGSDSRSESFAGQADVIVLAQVPNGTARVNLVSIARDTVANLPSGRQGKINATYASGGPSGAARAVSGLLSGLPIHFTIETTFNRFIRMSEFLGGYTVTNRFASTVGTRRFPAGPIRLHGPAALDYVRQRYGLPNGDLDRTERARAAITGMLGRMQDIATKEPGRLDAMVEAVFGQSRATVSLGQVRQMLSVLRAFERGNVSSAMLPVSGFGMVGGASVNLVNRARAAELAQALSRGDLSGYVARYGTSNAPTG